MQNTKDCVAQWWELFFALGGLPFFCVFSLPTHDLLRSARHNLLSESNDWGSTVLVPIFSGRTTDSACF